jgi:hypothetical protein
MHGRVWHDPTKTTSLLLNKAIKNAQNDILKQEFAKNNGYKYFAFWDDEEVLWKDQLQQLL